jgi:transposase InsO family protein
LIDFQSIVEVFYNVCRTSDEVKRIQNELRNIDINDDETYCEFSQRVLATRTAIEQSAAFDAIVLSRLQDILPDSIKLYINTQYYAHDTLKKPIDWTDIKKVCEILNTIDGPDDASRIAIKIRKAKEHGYPNGTNYSNKYRSHKKTFSSLIEDEYIDKHTNKKAKNNKYCKICGNNNTHTTTEHKQCTKCKLMGHTDNECRYKKHEHKKYNPYRSKFDRNNNNNKNNRNNSLQSNKMKGKLFNNNNDEHTNNNNNNKTNASLNNGRSIFLNQITNDKNNENSQVTSCSSSSLNNISNNNKYNKYNNEYNNNINNKYQYQYQYSDRKNLFCQTLSTSCSNDKRLIVKININDIEYDALIDTGASHSFVDRTLAQHLELKIEPTHGHIQNCHKETIHDRFGKTEPITIWCNNHSILTTFEIFDLPIDFIIGMDIFHDLGYSIAGINDGHEQTSTLSPPIPDNTPMVTPLRTPDIELTPEFIKDKEVFLKAIQNALNENKNIPMNSHCPVPEMNVYLPIPKDKPLYRRPKQFAEQQMAIFDEQIEKWLKEEIISPALPGNPYNNTLTMVPKKDANGNKTLWRVCLDPRPLNKLLPDDNHPIPLITDIMNKLGGNAIYSTIDLKQAYHRLPINDKDRILTAFTHNGIQYMFNRAPFGLKPLSSIFQRGMTRILGHLPFVCIFIDDIVVFSKHREDHAAHVNKVIQCLNEAKLIINQEKCHFYVTQILLLGHIIDINGKKVDPSKLTNIHEWQPPTTNKQIQSYMGTFNFFRQYIPLFSTLAAPLEKLRSKTESFKVNEEELNAFNSLKNLLINAPILHFPDFNKAFYVGTDASNVGIGAVLYQKDNNNSIKYISFMARTLQDRERRYSATQKELLAIVFALNKFHYYLWGRHFTLYTDHRALTYIHSQKDMSPMMTGWHDTILNYHFKIEYKPGIMNILPDHLSRLFPPTMKKAYDDIPSSSSNEDIANTYLHLLQDKDNKLNEIKEEKQKIEIMRKVHDLGHPGSNAMVKLIHDQNITWTNLIQDCIEYIKRCFECQRHNIVKKGYHPLKAIHANLPGEHMAMDLCGPFPPTNKEKKYVLILVDVCTRFVFLKAIRNKDGPTIGRALYKIFCLIGFPRILQSDNGTEFVNIVVKNLTNNFGTQHRLTTPYHPRGNGVVERNVQTLISKLKKEFHENDITWASNIPMVQLAMNTNIVALHNSSPFSLFFARKFNGFHNFTNDKDELLTRQELHDRLEYMTKVVFPAINEKSKETQRKMIERFNATVLYNDFPDGSKVMTLDPIKNDKLSPKYEGPYTVVRRTSGGTYELRDGTGALLGRNYAPSQLKLVLDEPSPENIYQVEKIVHHRQDPTQNNKFEYKVKWKGYPDNDNTWEPEDNFIERQCIRKYWTSINQSEDKERLSLTKGESKNNKKEKENNNKHNNKNKNECVENLRRSKRHKH